MRVEFGKLTADETKDLMREAIENLTEENIFEVLNQTLTKEQKSELSAEWEEVDSVK